VQVLQLAVALEWLTGWWSVGLQGRPVGAASTCCVFRVQASYTGYRRERMAEATSSATEA